MTTGIYKIASPNGFYIGSAVNIDRRWVNHRANLRRGSHKNRKLQNAWNKHGESAFVFSILLECAKGDLSMYEQIVLDAFKPRYNLSPSAGTNLGARWKCSPKARANMAAAQKRRYEDPEERRRSAYFSGRKHTEETKAKIRARCTPPPMSDEAKRKLRELKKGKPLSDETKAKMSAAQYRRYEDPVLRAHIAECNRLRAAKGLTPEHRAELSSAAKQRWAKARGE